jgi:polo-like kinase 1
MHGKNIIHRDLKLGNLFLDKHLRIKVGDLGLATKLSSPDEKRKTICGTPNYIAPEVIVGDKEKRGHSFEVDIWSMGVILYTLLVGRPPYESKDVKSTYQRILANQYSFPTHIYISHHSRDLISCLLQSCPRQRPSLEQIASHPFFTHETSKIPQSLPPCCTHFAPHWEEDENGNLVPIIPESKGKMRKSNVTNRKAKPTDFSTGSRCVPTT